MFKVAPACWTESVKPPRGDTNILFCQMTISTFSFIVVQYQYISSRGTKKKPIKKFFKLTSIKTPEPLSPGLSSNQIFLLEIFTH